MISADLPNNSDVLPWSSSSHPFQDKEYGQRHANCTSSSMKCSQFWMCQFCGRVGFVWVDADHRACEGLDLWAHTVKVVMEHQLEEHAADRHLDSQRCEECGGISSVHFSGQVDGSRGC